MTPINPALFPHAMIHPLNDVFAIVDCSAFAYMHATADKPIHADKGARHLGKPIPGIAVPFQTRRHAMHHKHFGLGTFNGGDGGEAGEPFAYGMGVSVTNEKRPTEYWAAAFIGDTIVFGGNRYTIEERPNNNIALIRA